MINEKLFILWDWEHGIPTLDDTGIIGRVREENVYISVYAKVKDEKSIKDLNIGEYILAEFNLSGEKKDYIIMRVQ